METPPWPLVVTPTGWRRPGRVGRARTVEVGPITQPGAATLEDLSVLVPEHAATASLAQQAYFLLRDRIVTLQLPPGSLVNERDLVDAFGLGRTPIREALHRLADDGLVEVYPRRGIYVGAVDVGDLRAISELRTELEGFAARLAAERASDADREAIARLRAELEQPPTTLAPPPAPLGTVAAHPDATGATATERRLIHLDQRIHRLVHRAAHNPVLEAALDRAYVLALRLWFVALERLDHLEDAVHEHTELLDAVTRGDARRAERIARAHVSGFEQQIRRLL